jgi:hypothetical protein
MKSLVLPLLLVVGACASAPAPRVLYFPELGRRVSDHEAAALDEVLALAAATPPGERLEELAEMAASYVVRDPEAFLRAQRDGEACFGVDFLGPVYVDDDDGRPRQIAARRLALMSVQAPDLASARDRCLGFLR